MAYRTIGAISGHFPTARERALAAEVQDHDGQARAAQASMDASARTIEAATAGQWIDCAPCESRWNTGLHAECPRCDLHRRDPRMVIGSDGKWWDREALAEHEAAK